MKQALATNSIGLSKQDLILKSVIGSDLAWWVN